MILFFCARVLYRELRKCRRRSVNEPESKLSLAILENSWWPSVIFDQAGTSRLLLSIKINISFWLGLNTEQCLVGVNITEHWVFYFLGWEELVIKEKQRKVEKKKIFGWLLQSMWMWSNFFSLFFFYFVLQWELGQGPAPIYSFLRMYWLKKEKKKSNQIILYSINSTEPKLLRSVGSFLFFPSLVWLNSVKDK